MWKLVQAELRYSGWSLLAGYTGLTLVFGLMTTDRLAYTLLLGYLVGYSAFLLFMSRVKENRELQQALLPVRRQALFVARISVLLLFSAGSVAIVWLFMHLPTYQRFHDVLTWRMLSAFLVITVYYVAASTLGDVKFEKDRKGVRFIYPGVLFVIWLIYYMLYLFSGNPEHQGPFWDQVRLIAYETPSGIAIAFVLICAMLFMNWQLFKRRTTFVK